MQGKNQNKSKSHRGRPKTSNLTAQEQNRLRKRRQRTSLAKQAISKVEIWLPTSLKASLKRASGGKTFSDIGQEALRKWLADQ
jgi:hypothetical protein